MAKCDACGRSENMPYQCRYCGGTYCGEHRLPENHSCPGLENWSDPSGVFNSGFDDSVNRSSGRSAAVLDRVLSTGGPLGYFRGNASYLFLALMWLTFAAQWAVLLTAGRNLHSTLFVLRSTNVEFVWTWVTSVFAHSPTFFFHIVGNSIVLYFFGPPVERYVGSRVFVALFLAAGVVAGLAQVLTGLVLGTPTGVVGASGAIMAVLGVLTVLNPDLRVFLLFPPIPIPIWVLTGFYAAASVFGIIAPASGGVAHFAHLTGLVIGLAYGQHAKGRRRTPQRLRLGGGGGGGGGLGGGRF